MSIEYRSPFNISELNDTIYCSMCSFDWIESGFSDDHFFSRIVKFDPWFNLDNTRACFFEGQAVSVVVVFERPMRIGSSIVQIGGLGSVGTHPSHRRKGYSSGVLSDTVGYLTNSGFDLSLLFTGINDHYAKAGWVTYPVIYHYINLKNINLPPKVDIDNLSIEQCNLEEHLPDLITIYDQFNQNRTGTVVRNRTYWQNQPKWRSQDDDLFWVAKSEGQILAYLKGGNKHLLEIGARIDLPMATLALDQLVAHFLQNRLDDGQEQVQLNDCKEIHQILERLSLPSSIRQDNHFMFRITNFRSLLTKLIPQMKRRIAASGWSQWRGIIRIAYELDSAILAIADSQIYLTDSKPTINLEFNQFQVLQLVFGELGDSILSDYPILSVLFPPDCLLHWSPDNF